MILKNNSRTKNSVLNIFSSFGSQLLITILRFVTRTVFIATLGKSYLGINGYFSDIISMLSLTELGFDTAITFKLYKPLAEHDDKRIRVLLKFYKLAYRGVGLAILTLGLLLIPLLKYIVRDYDQLAVIGVNAPLVFILYLLQSASSYLFFAYRSVVMTANQKKYVLDIADYLITILTNTVQILILIFFKNFLLYTAAVILFNLIKNLYNAWISKHYYPDYFVKERDSLTKEEVRELFKDCGALFIYKVDNVVIKATDNMVLGAFSGLGMVGLYSNYLLFFTTVQTFLRRLYTAVKASTGNLFVTESLEKKYLFFKTMNLLTAVLYGTAGVGIAVCADELITCWIGTDYLIARPFAFLIGVEVITSGMKQNLSQIRTVSGLFRQMWYRPLLSIIVNLVVSVVLAIKLGIYGVIIGTIAADVFTNFLIEPGIIYKYTFEGSRSVMDYYLRNMIYFLLTAAVCFIDFEICSHVFTGHGWLSCIFHAFIVMVTVPGVFLLIYARSEEFHYLSGLIKPFMNRLKRKMTHD